nr:hypothetical protein [Tanacetum cinerariifolium]
MDIFAFIYTSDPTKVRIIKQERNEGEARLLDTTIGRTIPLLPVAPSRAETELEASVDRLFDEGGSGNQTEQGDSVGGEKDANISPVVEATDISVENVVLVQSRRKGKRKSMIINTGEASHPSKKLRKDHGTPSETSLSDSSHHSGTNVADVEIDSLVRSSVLIMTIVTTITSTVDPTSVTKKKLGKPSTFCVGSSLASGTNPTMGVFLDLTGSDFLVGAIRTVINPDFDLQKVYLLLREAEAAKAIHLRSKASNFEAVEKYLRDETKALKEYNVVLEKEQNALDVKVIDLEASAVSKEVHELRFPLSDSKKKSQFPLAAKLGLNELQPIADQLMVPNHCSPDQVVVGATALSLALDVSSVWVLKIRENITNQRSALRDVLVPLAEPFSSIVLTRTKGTSDTTTTTANTTTALSITFASASTIAPIFVNDYVVIGVDDQAVFDGDVASFPNVDDVEMNIPQ